MPEEKTGLCLISVPKSGTMFLSRYLEQLTGLPVVFGLTGVSASVLAAEIKGRMHPCIVNSINDLTFSREAMSRRFSGMLGRNRKEVEACTTAQPRLFSDHGFHNFLRFLIDPSDDEIMPPGEILAWANERNLKVCYLHRGLGAIAVSLAHFLASGKSFLLSAKDLDAAFDMVVEAHVPVLAAHMNIWRPYFDDPLVIPLTYEDLTAEPAKHIPALAADCGLPLAESKELINRSEQYRSWTWRSGHKPSWRESMPAGHVKTLETRFAALVG